MEWPHDAIDALAVLGLGVLITLPLLLFAIACNRGPREP